MIAKYNGDAVCVGHYLSYTYVHFMSSTSDESTLENKNAYEQLLNSYDLFLFECIMSIMSVLPRFFVYLTPKIEHKD